MLILQTALKEYAVEAKDGRLGSVKDCLFDQRNRKIRWMVLDTGNWLSGRQVLIHPSAFGSLNRLRNTVPVDLTKLQIEASPEIAFDRPVSLQHQDELYGYYGWDSMWGGSGYYAGFPMATEKASNLPMHAGAASAPDTASGDPNLQSMHAVQGYRIEATDGIIGHLENFLIDDLTWDISYLVADTRNWWVGQHVLLSPFAVKEFDWIQRQIHVSASREQVKASPPWNPEAAVDESYQTRLHTHYDWPRHP